MTANVPTIESGTATPGIRVAEMLRRNRKITITTRQMVSTRVNFTSWIDLRIDSEASNAMCRLTGRRDLGRNYRQQLRTLSTTSTVLVPGWRWMARMMLRSSLNQAADLVVLHAVEHVAELLQAHRIAVA